MASALGMNEFFACCGSTRFAEEMVSLGPFSTYDQAVDVGRDIWFNKVDVNGWLQAFAAHPQIGQSASSSDHKSPTSAQWSKGEQSTALATATASNLQELYDWNARYQHKFGFVFLICASGRTSLEILAELKRRYPNRPIVELENAAQEQMKITELRLAKLFSAASSPSSDFLTKAGDRMTKIGAHLTTSPESSIQKPPQTSIRTRPPITTHVLDVARGSPAAGIEVRLEMLKTDQRLDNINTTDCWIFQGSSTTDKDGRSGQLMNITDALNPGIYRITFNTRKYNPNGFFPYVSIVFEIQESQKFEHFHVPLLLSPFSYSTYRGS